MYIPTLNRAEPKALLLLIGNGGLSGDRICFIAIILRPIEKLVEHPHENKKKRFFKILFYRMFKVMSIIVCTTLHPL